MGSRKGECIVTGRADIHVPADHVMFDCEISKGKNPNEPNPRGQNEKGKEPISKLTARARTVPSQVLLCAWKQCEHCHSVESSTRQDVGTLEQQSEMHSAPPRLRLCAVSIVALEFR